MTQNAEIESTPEIVPARNGRRLAWKHPLALALATAIPFLPVLVQRFVVWDDNVNFFENASFGGLSWARVGWAWRTFHLGVYQPLAWMLLEAEATLWGLDGRAYHAVSLFLHAAIAVVLWALIVALLDRILPEDRRRDHRSIQVAAAVAALLFAVHPLRVEVVAWASCQPYLPAILCVLLATLAYLRAHPAVGATHPGWLILAWLLFALATLFKAVAVSLPLVLLILDVYPLRRLGPGRWLKRWVWVEKLLFVALSVPVMLVAVQAKHGAGHLVRFENDRLEARVAQACYGLCFYAVKTVWPSDLSCFYMMPKRVNLWTWPFGMAAAAVALVSLGAVLVRRRWPGLTAAWVAYLVLLAPNLGLVRIGFQIAADRYSYLATVPWVVVLAYGLFWLAQRIKDRPARITGAVSAGMAVVLTLGVLSWQQCRTWRSSIVLFSTALERGSAESPDVQTNLGAALLRAGRVEEGAVWSEKAVRMHPNAHSPYFNLGLVRLKQGRDQEAADLFATAISFNPKNPNLYYHLGIALVHLGQVPEAAAQFATAVQLDPDDPNARFNLGITLARQGRMSEAAAQFAASARLRPDDPDAHLFLARALDQLGRREEAAAHYVIAARLQPDRFQGPKSDRLP